MGEEEWKLKDSYNSDREVLNLFSSLINWYYQFQFQMVAKEDAKTNTMIFSLKNQPGGLARALKVFQVKTFGF